MIRFAHALLASVLASGSAGCLLYTDPINVAPVAHIQPPAEALHRNQSFLWTAIASDPDGDSLTFSWQVEDGPCPTKAAALDQTREYATEPTFSHQPRAVGAPFCVFVVVRDSHGATTLATSPGHLALNLAPVAAVALWQPAATTTAPTSVPLMSTVRLSGLGSSDPESEALSFAWTVTSPAGQPVPISTCAPHEEGHICFVATEPGEHRAELVVTDETGLSSQPAHGTVTVDPDQPPCLTLTEPPLDVTTLPLAPQERRAFRVLAVDDDVDPRPAPPNRHAEPFPFVWSLRTPGGSFMRTSVSVEEFPLVTAAFQPGDELDVRVRYLDSEDRRPGTTRPRNPCPAEVDRCELSLPNGKTCTVWKTWRVRFR